MLRSAALIRTLSHVRTAQTAAVAGRVTRALAAQTRLSSSKASVFTPCDQFLDRHIGPKDEDVQVMLQQLGFKSLSELVDSTIPSNIRLKRALALDGPLSETQALEKLKNIVSKNKVLKSFIGMGYYETCTPGVIQRNMLENPGWYTAYTPYQAEISQGRLEMLLNFQTMVADLTGMDLSNASLLDEATAAAEAMSMAHALHNNSRKKFFVADDSHPQNIALLQTRAEAIGVEIVVGKPSEVDLSTEEFCGAMVQYPSTFGDIEDYTQFVRNAKNSDTLAVAASDLLALTLIKSPGEVGFDVVVGSSQRFGVPMNFGGPHAAFLATSEEHSRKLAGRIIGVSIDSRGKPALRMAMQTREQHIRRDKATSNICTAQALLANMAAAYAVYHGPEGVKRIAQRVNGMAVTAAEALRQAGYTVPTEHFFDTFVVDVSSKGKTSKQLQDAAEEHGVNVRVIDENRVGLAFGEAHTEQDVRNLLQAFGVTLQASEPAGSSIPAFAERGTPYMTHPVFNSHHSETQMLRYLKVLENKDLALNTSMISLGSCTMKLNATAEMVPITWNEICNLHPFAPNHQWEGMREMIESLNRDLAEITGFAAVSAQPNSGAQGEYAGLLAIRNYLHANNQGHRNVCLIPVSAHGTNPASAAMAGLKVVVVKSDAQGNVDFEDLKAKAEQHAENLACLMITYPSTYGIFEERVRDICDLIHDKGGLIYMDGANMNAQVGLTAPGFIGADVCHLNLHKTFCIPHGGGGPGVGAIGVVERLAPYLPGHPVVPVGGEGKAVQPKTTGAVSAAPYGSAAILPISWMYIKMMGASGLLKASSVAILSANYMASRLRDHYDILYKGRNGQCAHEYIVDLRPFKRYGIKEEDVAKRLQDYGFHSPTMSWPVPGTLMVEPTESEDKAELDRFIDAMISIRQEIEDVVQGRIAPEDSPLTNAPHTMDMVTDSDWNRRYSREVAAFPAPWTRLNKFWPSVGRVDNVYGDRNLVCSCPPIESYMEVPVSVNAGERNAQA